VRVGLRCLAALALVAAGLVIGVRRAPLWVDLQFTHANYYLAGINSDSIVLDGQALHYVEGGAGAPVVLVHGLGGSAELDWSELLPQLVHAGYHVYAMDLLGFGDSAKPSDRSYSIAEQARLVVKFLDAMHLDRVALAGESMGGWIASMVALNSSDRVSQLILFDSAGLTFEPSFDLSLLTPRTKEQVDALHSILVPDARPLPDYVKEAYIRETRRDGWVIERALASMLTGADLLDRRFSALKIPLLIVWGKQDALTPLRLGEAMHEAAPQSVLEVYDGCGHISVKTCARQVGRMTVGFLNGTTPRFARRIEIPALNLP
jgi:pimeloyl-ACP methyl ester carboxylesterase